MKYMVKLSDGRQFGPADVALLSQWARERRIPKDALLVPAEGGEAISALSVPEVALILQPSHPPTVAGEMPTPDAPMSVMIPYRNGAALTAYYLGIFAFIPVLGILLGAAAFVLGVIGLKARQRRPEIHGSVHAWIGIIIGGGLALLQVIIFIAFSLAAASY